METYRIGTSSRLSLCGVFCPNHPFEREHQGVFCSNHPNTKESFVQTTPQNFKGHFPEFTFSTKESFVQIAAELVTKSDEHDQLLSSQSSVDAASNDRYFFLMLFIQVDDCKKLMNEFQQC